MEPFTQSQIIVFRALASGATITAAAELASISRTTIYEWMQDIAFQRAIAYAQQEFAITIRDRMQALAAKALDKLEAILDNPKASPSVQLKAALAILNRPQFPKQGWALPAPTLAEAQQCLASVTARMESESNRDFTNSYTNSTIPNQTQQDCSHPQQPSANDTASLI